MRKKHYSVNQILQFLKMADSCGSLPALAQSIDVSERTLYRWKLRYTILGPDPAGEIRRLRNENMLLKSLNVALLRETHVMIKVIAALGEEAGPAGAIGTIGVIGAVGAIETTEAIAAVAAAEARQFLPQ
ncbi:MAG TPA: transposase [Herbaspirillum sp.]